MTVTEWLCVSETEIGSDIGADIEADIEADIDVRRLIASWSRILQAYATIRSVMERLGL